MVIAMVVDNELTLYTDNGKTIPSDIEELKNIVNNDEILYITSLEEVSCEDLYPFISKKPKKDNTQYVVLTRDGQIIFEEEKFIFNGYGDFKRIDKNLSTIIKESNNFQNGLKTGVLKIVNQKDLKNILDDKKIKQEKRKQWEEKDRQNRETPSHKSAIELQQEMMEGDVADEMDITGDVKTGSGKGLSDEFKEIEEFESLNLNA